MCSGPMTNLTAEEAGLVLSIAPSASYPALPCDSRLDTFNSCLTLSTIPGSSESELSWWLHVPKNTNPTASLHQPRLTSVTRIETTDCFKPNSGPSAMPLLLLSVSSDSKWSSSRFSIKLRHPSCSLPSTQTTHCSLMKSSALVKRFTAPDALNELAIGAHLPIISVNCILVCHGMMSMDALQDSLFVILQLISFKDGIIIESDNLID
jgi:hypothetical protein